MKKSYGEMILPKDSILYHTSDNIFEYKNENEKAMLFCVFHPSEADITNEYVTFIKLKKDVSLLFMVEGCKKMKIYSSLLSFTNHLSLNLAKKNNNQLLSYAQELKKENFDGWFTSIENRGGVEVSLINDQNIFEAIKTDELKRYWRNGHYSYDTKSIIPKNWGNKYLIIEKPIILNIHIRYKNIIEQYLKDEMEYGNYKEYIFYVLLNNVQIYYHEGDLEKIEWKIIY
jgi:hypothetical protein